jgi:SNF2 family DNA or RNA helicase
LNAEGDLLERLIPGAVQLSGSDSADRKEEVLLAFSRGDIRVLVTKPIIGAWGLNWQHCNRMTFFPSHSYEQYYQAVRRCWRFGQQNPVQVDLITTEGGRNVLKNLQRKSEQADAMFARLVEHMRDALAIDRGGNYDVPVQVPEWLR